MDKIPALSVDLIDELDKKFPSKCPPLEATDREIWFYAGQRSVVDHLKSILKDQEENILQQY